MDFPILPLEILELILSYLSVPNLKKFRVVCKHFNTRIPYIIKDRFPNLDWNLMKSVWMKPFLENRCHIPNKCFQLRDWHNWSQLPFKRFKAVFNFYSHSQSHPAALLDKDGHMIGDYVIIMWSHKHKCTIARLKLPVFQDFILDENGIAFLTKADSIVRVFSFYEKESTPAFYSFKMSKIQNQILHFTEKKSSISPNGKYIYLFDTRQILSHTGKKLDLPKKWTFIINNRYIMKNRRVRETYKWTQDSIFTIPKHHFKENKRMRIRIENDTIIIL